MASCFLRISTRAREKIKLDRYSGLTHASRAGSAVQRDGSIAKAFRGGRGLDQCGQATKGVWGMSGRQEAMKGVEDCDKPGEAVKRALIPGSLN